MRQIQIKELSTPEAMVMSRIVETVGLNVRPQKAIFDERTRIWTVPLKIIVPSQVMNKEKPIRTFLYQFEDIGSARLIRKGDEYTFLEFPKVPDIDESLYVQWYDLTQKLENEILKVGQMIWGDLIYVQMLLRPMYSIILNVLANTPISQSELKEDDSQLKHLRFLEANHYLEFNESENNYRASNILNGLAQRFFEKHNDGASEFTVISKIVGGIFASHYREIKNKLHAHAPSVYVDTSMAYYLDAIRTGEPIQMTRDELWKKYKLIGHKPVPREISAGYNTVISEIVLGKLLNRDSDSGYIYAQDAVFQQLAPLGEELAEHLAEI